MKRSEVRKVQERAAEMLKSCKIELTEIGRAHV